jgi:hypothetical protein
MLLLVVMPYQGNREMFFTIIIVAIITLTTGVALQKLTVTQLLKSSCFIRQLSIVPYSEPNLHHIY